MIAICLFIMAAGLLGIISVWALYFDRPAAALYALFAAMFCAAVALGMMT